MARVQAYWKQKVKQWARSIHQNFRAEVRKFLGGKWIATDPEGLVPFHSQKEFRPHLKGGCWIAVARVRVTRQIRLYQLYYASCFMRWNFARIINGLFWADCILLRVKFKDLRTPLSNNERIFESLSGNRPFFYNSQNIHCVTQLCNCCYYTCMYGSRSFRPMSCSPGVVSPGPRVDSPGV